MELGGPPPSGPSWVELKDFFPPTPGMPPALGGIDVGQPAAPVPERLAALTLAGARVQTETNQGLSVHSAVLGSYPTVTAVILTDTDRIVSVQLNLPAAEAGRMLTETWGLPQGFSLESEDTAWSWTDGARTYEWRAFPNRTHGLLKIVAASTAER